MKKYINLKNFVLFFSLVLVYWIIDFILSKELFTPTQQRQCGNLNITECKGRVDCRVIFVDSFETGTAAEFCVENLDFPK